MTGIRSLSSTRTIPRFCNTITINMTESSSFFSRSNISDISGQYQLTGEYSRGAPVFKHETRSLYIRAWCEVETLTDITLERYYRWGVFPELRSEQAIVRCATHYHSLCPAADANTRMAVWKVGNTDTNVRGWKITVTCDTH